MTKPWFTQMQVDFSRIRLGGDEDDGSDGVYSRREDYFYKRLDGIETPVASYEPNFFILQVFLDQFRDAGRPLPDVDPNL